MVQLVIPINRGGVPCLTPAQVERIVSTTSSASAAATCVLSFSVFDAHVALKACDKLGMSYTEFCGYKDRSKYPSIMTVRQAWVGAHSPAPSTENAVVGESEAGRVVLDMATFVKTVAAFKPTWCLPLYAPNPLEDPPTKKHRTASARTAKWLDAAVAADTKTSAVAVPASIVAASAATSSTQQSPLVFLDAAGQGESLGARVAAIGAAAAAATATSSDPEGDNANTLAPSATSTRTFVIAESIPALLMAALAGATLVECEYAFACARRGQSIDLLPLLSALLCEVAPSASKSFAFVTDLTDKKYQLDTVPFASDCPCYSCARHTKAYVYHLLSVQEMNSDTILTIHNLSQILLLVDALRQIEGKADRSVRISRALRLLVPA